ncbi:MAG: TrkA family potassium uptake protein [Desulfurococcales archaeon]|nr:TrkA family potassium uptake protein [Desulfurococcales archaeon]
MKILVIGGGGVGESLCVRLAKVGHSVVVVDKDESKVRRITAEADVEGIVRDATDPMLYDELDLETFDVVVAATDRDEVNLFVSSIAKEYGVNRIFVRAKNRATIKLLNMLGVEASVAENDIVAGILFSEIEGRFSAVEIVNIYTGNFVIVSRTVTKVSKALGKSVREITSELPPTLKIIAVFDGENFLDPDKVLSLEPGYIIIALSKIDSVDKLDEAIG